MDLSRLYEKRWWLVLLSILTVVAVASGAAKVVQTADYKVYFDKGDELLMRSEKLGDDYSRSDNVLFVLAPKDGEVFTQPTLAAVKTLTEKAWKLPLSTRVDSITNYQHSYADQDELIIADLVSDPAALDAQQLAAVKATALAEPNLVKRLISEDGTVTAVNVTINFTDGKVDTETREVVAAARALVAETEAAHPEIDLYLTGIVLMNNAFPETSEKDGATLVPAMLLIILVGLFLLLRSAAAVGVTLLVMLLSIAASMGVAGWMGYKINPVSGAAPIIILTVAVADCVHILISFFHNFRNTAMCKGEAMGAAIKSNARPVLLTTLSTGIGFLSMNFSDAPPFRELGNIVAGGIFAACFLSLTLLPALLTLLPLKKGKQEGKQNVRLSNALLSLSKKVWAAPRQILIGGLIASVLLSAAAFRNELNEDFVRYFDESFDVRVSTEFTLKNLTGISVVEYDFAAPEGNSVSDPAYLNKLDSFAQWLYQQPEVKHVNTFSDTIKRLNKNLNGDREAAYQIPDSNDLIAQYILLYENSLPFGLGTTDRVLFDKSGSRVTVTLGDVTNNQLLAFEARSQAWLKENFPQGMQSEGLGWSMMFGGVAQKNIASMLEATFLAVLLISVIMAWSFRSVKLGVLSLLPNLAPAFVALGVWGLTVGFIGMAASIITALTFGIVVDDSIHFINRYMHNRRTLGMSLKDALENTFVTVGKAIVVTSVILVIGFGLLTTSGFKVNSVIGYLSAITIFVAVVMDLVLLPALLIKLDRWLFPAKAGEKATASAQ